MNILAISDSEPSQMHNIPYLRRKYKDVDILVSCGDLAASYVEYLTTVLSAPMFYVRGNHDTQYTDRHPGGVNLHRQFVRYRGLWMAGLEGSRRYNKGPIQYTDTQMLFHVLGLAPGMLLRRARWKTGVDLMVTHAPPRGIHDREDLPHQGFRAFHLLIRWYRPRYMIHGHIDIWDRRDATWTEYLETQVVNINPVRLLTVDVYKRHLIGRSQPVRS